MDTLRRALFDSLLGPLTLVARDDALVGVYFPGHRVEPERALAGVVGDADQLYINTYIDAASK